MLERPLKLQKFRNVVNEFSSVRKGSMLAHGQTDRWKDGKTFRQANTRVGNIGAFEHWSIGVGKV